MNKVIVILIAVLVLGSGAFALAQLSSDNKTEQPTATQTETPTPNQPTQSTQPEETDAESEQDQAETATVITYDGSSFSPASLTVTAGTTITVRNNSAAELEFNSDPHPAHTINNELNINDVQPGQSQTFTLNTTGTFGYHNHLNSTHTGSITVQ